MSADKGFFYRRAAIDGKDSHCPEIDILIHDTQQYRPIFRMGDFVIVQPQAVRGMIQVKRTFSEFLAYMALKAKSTRWAGSTVTRDTTAYRAVESHFGHLDGWQALTQAGQGLPYGDLARFLMRHYPPHLPGSTERPGGEEPG